MSLTKHLKNLTAGDVLRLQAVPMAAWPWVVQEIGSSRQEAGSKKMPPVLVVVPDPAMVDGVAASVAALCPARQVMAFPVPDVAPYDRLSTAPALQAERLAVQQALQQGEAPVVITSVPALAWRVPATVDDGLHLKRGGFIAPADLAASLTRLGYTRVEQVSEVGEWAQRGGVVDVWPARELPVRIEFFDDEMERMVAFEAASQRTVEDVGNVSIQQVREVVVGAERVEAFRQNYRTMFEGGSGDTAYAQVSEGVLPAHTTQLLPLFWEEDLPSLLDMLPESTCCVVPSDIAQQATAWDELVGEAYAARLDAEKEGAGERIRAVPPETLMVPAPELMRTLQTLTRVELNALDDGGEGVRLNIRTPMFASASNNRHAAAQMAAKEVVGKLHDGYRIVLTAPSPMGLSLLLKALEGEGAPPVGVTSSLAAAMKVDAGAVAAVSPVGHGWIIPADKLMVLTEGDVFGTRLGRAAAGPKRKRRSEDMIAHFSELREGDYVVHEDHGIAKFAGLLTMDVNGQRQDFLKLLYAGDDRLFVPVENLGVLSRYKGGDSGTVTLDKLGGTGWHTRKAKVQEDLMAMADDLLKTAAARNLSTRDPLVEHHGAATTLYAEFCAGFPYDLTDDQQRVMDDVEADFASHTPMDRLVVGDVGFGKTEVALRAAYLAAAAGKQVAIVCPTTLLARQHYDIFQQRFAGFPMQVGRLSRLVPAGEVKTTHKRLAEGSMDIVVGTHAVLSKSLEFKNLGLVVIDEEQRFGVAHKERLKTMCAHVDVLTLTATPIPRTLQMAVGGVRQLSLITTPPVDRQAVATFVLPWDNKTIAEAVKREITRGGQVYVVAPHVEDLPALRDSLAGLVPNLRLGIAHGQMPEGDLEDVMGAFYEGKLTVLLATTIIESGLDVPKANTLIVYRADRFGLAQLYQLRGRVGRSTRRAFAYFIMPEGGMGEEAVKRLTILQRLTELGAGFTLASYDMDIRGFGNLLGKQQSGNIQDIGFELYNKMLKEAVDERSRMKAKEPLPAAEHSHTVTLKLGLTYLIPESYVPNEADKLQLYRRLAGLKDAEALADFKAELADRYGAPPPEVEALLTVMSLRARAEKLNIAKLEVGEKGVSVAFHHGRFANPAGLMKHIMKHAGVISVRPDQSLVWHRHGGDDRLVLHGVGGILSELEKCLSIA
ncbi:MAG: transcription-repair coupling factor [Alphaproteobacteria bacterium]